MYPLSGILSSLGQVSLLQKDLPKEQFRCIKVVRANAHWAAFKEVTIWRMLDKAQAFQRSERVLLGIAVVIFFRAPVVKWLL